MAPPWVPMDDGSPEPAPWAHDLAPALLFSGALSLALALRSLGPGSRSTGCLPRTGSFGASPRVHLPGRKGHLLTGAAPRSRLPGAMVPVPAPPGVSPGSLSGGFPVDPPTGSSRAGSSPEEPPGAIHRVLSWRLLLGGILQGSSPRGVLGQALRSPTGDLPPWAHSRGAEMSEEVLDGPCPPRQAIPESREPVVGGPFFGRDP